MLDSMTNGGVQFYYNKCFERRSNEMLDSMTNGRVHFYYNKCFERRINEMLGSMTNGRVHFYYNKCFERRINEMLDSMTNNGGTLLKHYLLFSSILFFSNKAKTNSLSFNRQPNVCHPIKDLFVVRGYQFFFWN
jgi:hypothetical protein